MGGRKENPGAQAAGGSRFMPVCETALIAFPGVVLPAVRRARNLGYLPRELRRRHRLFEVARPDDFNAMACRTS
jgi:hypothetical protein